MADKNYKLTFNLSDGSTQEVQFTAPQGEQGKQGEPGSNGVGISSISITEVS